MYKPIIAERSWARARTNSPVMNEGSMLEFPREVLPLRSFVRNYLGTIQEG